MAAAVREHCSRNPCGGAILLVAMDTSSDGVTPSSPVEPAEPPKPGRRSPFVAAKRAGAWARLVRDEATIRAARARSRHASVRVAFEAYERDSLHAGGLLAGGLAYRLFLWILPFALAVSTVSRLISSGTGNPPDQVARDWGMSRALIELVREATAESSESAVGLFVVGMVLTLWTGMGVLKGLRLASAITWGVRPAPLIRPLQAAAATSLALSGLLVGTTAVALAFGGYGAPVLVLVDGAIFITAATWAALALPHPPGIGIRDVLPGAVLFAVGIGGLSVISRVYLADRIQRADNLYGAIGLATVFLLWLFLLARLVVAGLALNATLRQQRLITSEGSPPTDATS